MKRIIIPSAILFITILLLAACENNREKESGKGSEDSVLDSGVQKDNNKNVKSNQEEDSNETQASSDSEIGDQLNLTVGDTGTFDTTLGKYEMTVNSAKLVGSELDGQKSLLDELILLEVTIKNTSDNEINIEEVMESMGVSSDLEGSNSYDGADDFDSVEKFKGILAPGEEKTGQLIIDVYTSDEYYFKKDTGNIAGGSSNQVIWTIKAEEAK